MVEKLNKGIYHREGKRAWYFIHRQNGSSSGFGVQSDGTTRPLSTVVDDSLNFVGHQPVSRLVIPGEFV